MKIQLPYVAASNSTQPATATILAANPARVDAIIVYEANGPFYIKRGTGAAANSHTWKVTTLGQTITIENYTGIITCSPTPSAGDLSVSEGVDRIP